VGEVLSDSSKLAELEALLYAASRPVSLTDIVMWLRLRDEVEADSLVSELQAVYMEEGSALELVKLRGERVVLQLKPDYTKLAGRYSIKPLLSVAALRTLSYVAYYQPVLQSDVAKVRGSQAYKHLKQLEEMGLVSRVKRGRTKVVKTTQEFADYLGLSGDRTQMRRQLRKLFRRLEIEQLEKR